MPPVMAEYIINVLVPYGGKTSRKTAEKLVERQLDEIAHEMNLRFTSVSSWKRRDWNEVVGRAHARRKTTQ